MFADVSDRRAASRKRGDAYEEWAFARKVAAKERDRRARRLARDARPDNGWDALAAYEHHRWEDDGGRC